MAYAQHQSNFNAFWSVRKTYPTQVEKKESLAVNFFSKQSVPGLQTTTRYYKNKGGEILPLTGTYIDAFTEESITGISLVEPKELDGGVTIPEQIVVDITCPVAGKVDRLQMSSDSKWGNDFARKIVKADLSQPLTIKPFSFIPEGKDKALDGLTIYQDGNKIADNYKQSDGTTTTNINGVEQFDELASKAKEVKNEKLRSNAWKTYFATVNVFVVEKMMEFVKTADLADVPEADVDVVTDEEADDVAF
jgi:hypothetical protein